MLIWSTVQTVDLNSMGLSCGLGDHISVLIYGDSLLDETLNLFHFHISSISFKIVAHYLMAAVRE